MQALQLLLMLPVKPLSTTASLLLALWCRQTWLSWVQVSVRMIVDYYVTILTHLKFSMGLLEV